MDRESRGDCRRRAPSVGVQKWPVTAFNGWCGEFEATAQRADEGPPIRFPVELLSVRSRNIIERLHLLPEEHPRLANVVNNMGPRQYLQMRNSGRVAVIDIYNALKTVLDPSEEWKAWAASPRRR